MATKQEEEISRDKASECIDEQTEHDAPLGKKKRGENINGIMPTDIGAVCEQFNEEDSDSKPQDKEEGELEEGELEDEEVEDGKRDEQKNEQDQNKENRVEMMGKTKDSTSLDKNEVRMAVYLYNFFQIVQKRGNLNHLPLLFEVLHFLFWVMGWVGGAHCPCIRGIASVLSVSIRTPRAPTQDRARNQPNES